MKEPREIKNETRKKNSRAITIYAVETMRRALLLILLFLSCLFGYAQEISETYVTSDTLQVYFRQDKILLESQFRDNGKRLEEFSHHFNSLLSNPKSKVRSILIVSGASPEGPSARNRYLSDNRAKVVYDYLLNNHLVDSAHIEIESRGVDWKGLTVRVKESDLAYKNEVLDILELPEWISEGGKVKDSRKARLMNYQGGSVWNELYELYFADLRGTKVMIAYNILKPKAVRPINTPPVEVQMVELSKNVPPMPVFEPINVEPPKVKPPKDKKPFYLAIETNLLGDALLIPNIGAEVGIYKGLTVGGNYQNIWLRNSSYTRWYRFEGFEAGINYYINEEKRPFKGHHIGVYGQLVTWDFTINGRGYLAERWAYGGGVSYGYALPIGKRFNIDFEIGVGYLGGKMHEYIPEDGHRVWQSYEPFQWIGPTKLGITLQWLIGRGNYNGKEVKGNE